MTFSIITFLIHRDFIFVKLSWTREKDSQLFFFYCIFILWSVLCDSVWFIWPLYLDYNYNLMWVWLVFVSTTGACDGESAKHLWGLRHCHVISTTNTIYKSNESELTNGLMNVFLLSYYSAVGSDKASQLHKAPPCTIFANTWWSYPAMLC